ncbi:hypothetical protein EYF80_039030 [Liparis tanakae]|uniref:Uncharacterized protein n=1 Tax=Liparis tanakae TaxID=230148 RepID=A0A4Z2GCB9_9TELE|nr:hypothetical protein EYF80_039030 [Liparis tanakae]
MVTMPSRSKSMTSSNSVFLSRTQSSSMSCACWFSTVPTGSEMNSDNENLLVEILIEVAVHLHLHAIQMVRGENLVVVLAGWRL